MAYPSQCKEHQHLGFCPICAEDLIAHLVQELKRISEPTGAWNNDKEIFYKNIIDSNIEIAKAAIAKGEGKA